MAVSLVGYTSAEFTTGVFNYTLTPGGTIADGDWLVAVAVTGQGQVLAVPTGWTALYNMKNTGTLNTAVFIKKRVAGDTGYTFTFGGATTSGKIALMWVRGAADTGWVIPTDGRYRANSGATFNNIADPITVAANTMALVISTERTTATEANISSMTGATPWFFVAQNGGVQIETIAVGSVLSSGGGATPSVTITYPNTQAANGWAVQLGIPVAPNPVVGGLSRWVGGVEVPLTVKLWNGTAEVALTQSQPAIGNYRIADLLATTPFYIAHRGSMDNWPEHTMRAFKNAVNYGMKAIEVSVNVTTDNVIFCHHDTNLSRMTGTNLAFTAATAAQVDALTTTGGLTDNPTQDRVPVARLTDVLAAYASNHVLFIEPKSGGAWQSDLIALIKTYPDITNRIVWKAPIVSGFSGAKTAGFTTWGYLLQDDPAHADWQTLVAKSDVDWIGVNHTATDAYIQGVVALANSLGKKVIMWEIHTTAMRDRALSLGVTGMMTSNVRTVLPKYP
jgi:glycerophosphoryl diester phosphodiesterase